MKTRKILVTILLINCTILSFAKDISRSTAEKVAINFFYERSNVFNEAVNYHDLSIIDINKVDDTYFVINLKNGWVLIAADDAMVPILGYNYQGKFPSSDQQGYNAKSFLQHYVEQINYIRENNIEADDEMANRWDYYLKSDPTSLLIYKGDRDQVDPLITSLWHTGFLYNVSCPPCEIGEVGHSLVGCIATAMSMIMHYWRYPLQGIGEHSYYLYPYGNLYANFGEANYEWDSMMDEIDNDNPWETAEICFHTGISMDMQYCQPLGSGANESEVPYALVTYFNFDASCQYVLKDDFTMTDWENMIQSDLDESRPNIYFGYEEGELGGHAFICDGYEGDNYYHFNFGLGGTGNGYYSLADIPYWNTNQGMIYQIFPNDPAYPYIADGEAILTTLSGSFTDGSGPAEDYPIGVDASWIIDPQTENDSVTNITLNFVQFNTASSDYLRVYDGETIGDELIGEFSGDELPGSVTSTGNKILVTFSSTGTGEGFKVEFNTSGPTYCQPQQLYTDPSGTISDGSGTFYYNNLTSCIYIIQHEEVVNYNLEFTSFSTEENKDVVTIYNGDQEVVGEFSGSEVPDILEIETNMVFIAWSTNAYTKDEGWSLEYTVSGVGIQDEVITNKLTIVPNPFTTSTTLSYELGQPETITLSIYNHLGQLVYQTQENQPQGNQQLIWNAEGLADGIYYYRLQVGEQVANGKMVKVR